MRHLKMVVTAAVLVAALACTATTDSPSSGSSGAFQDAVAPLG